MPQPGITDNGPHSEVFVVSSGQRRPLAPGQGLTVGREPDCELVLPQECVSRHHAQLFRDERGMVFIRDLGSRNGTFAGHRAVIDEQVSTTTQFVLGGADGGRIDVVFVGQTMAGAGVRGTSDIDGSQILATHVAAGQSRLIPGLRNSVITVGRAPDNTVVLDDPLVSRHHARLLHHGERYRVVDLRSRNGIQVNGMPVSDALIGPEDRLTIGATTFSVNQGDLLAEHDSRVTLAAQELTYALPNGRRLLDGVSFAVPHSSLLAVVGPSGAGKSTLIRALTGSQPATSGQVIYGGRSLYHDYANLRQRIGVVPQDDVVHRQLSVRQALRYAAELRLPADYTRQAREAEIERVLNDLELTGHADTQISKISGGQRKRTSVALELLTQPSLLLLDEPTSGLDPNLDRSVMHLLRTQADSGRIVIVITHSVANLELCDNVMVLAPGGRIAYFGPPRQALAHFGATDYADVFERISRDPDAAVDAFRARNRPPAAPPVDDGASGLDVPPPAQKPSRQWNTLMRRQLRIMAADRSYAVSTLLLPIVIAAMMLVIPGKGGFGTPSLADVGEPVQLLTIMIVGAAFMGMAASIRELIAERAIFLRERAVGLSPPVYLFAKVCVLLALTLAQSMLLILVVRLGKPAPGRGVFLESTTPELVIAAFGTAFASAMVGLVLSAVVGTSEQTMPALVIAVMAQLVLCGGVIRVSGRTVMEVVAAVAPARWGFCQGAATIDLLALNPKLDHDGLWEHSVTSWLLSAAGLALIIAVAAAASVIALRRQRSST